MTLNLTDEQRAIFKEIQRQIGQHTSKKKAASSRENGKKGGRPKKQKPAVARRNRNQRRLMSKAKPKPGESRLIHITENTGHRSEFALTWANYDPRTVHVAAEMLHDQAKVVGGFYLITKPNLSAFSVCVPDAYGEEFPARITSNKVEVNVIHRTITLTSRILKAAEDCCHETMGAAADLEQCAAIAIAFELDCADFFAEPVN